MQLTQQNKTDILEVVIILALFFLVVVIFVPVAIWEEETYYACIVLDLVVRMGHVLSPVCASQSAKLKDSSRANL